MEKKLEACPPTSPKIDGKFYSLCATSKRCHSIALPPRALEKAGIDADRSSMEEVVLPGCYANVESDRMSS